MGQCLKSNQPKSLPNVRNEFSKVLNVWKVSIWGTSEGQEQMLLISFSLCGSETFNRKTSEQTKQSFFSVGWLYWIQIWEPG